LRPFFPSRTGTAGEVQARRYIRESAIGRGKFPPGSPQPKDLLGLLTAEGFTSGGRQGRLYAPWSSIVSAGGDDFRLRTELLAFLRNDRRGPTVERMLKRIRHLTGWPTP
jgi:hypothetical protein